MFLKVVLLSCYVTGEMGPDFSSKTQVNSLTSQQIVRMHQLFRQAKFDDPSGDVRCPLSINQLKPRPLTIKLINILIDLYCFIIIIIIFLCSE